MADRRPPSVARRGSPEQLTPQRGPERGPAASTTRAPEWQRVGGAGAARATVTHRMAERLDERKQRERRRRTIALAKWLVVALVIGAAAWAVFSSSVFAVRADAVEWIGLSPEIDAEAAAEVVASVEGESIVSVDLGALERRLGDVAGVREASIERVWPAGLRVTLVARRPVAAVPDPAGFVLLDAEAVAVGTVATAPTDVPLVEVPVGDERILAAVLEVISALPADLVARVGTVSAATEDSIGFSLVDGPRVEWGSAEDSALKAQVLQAMMTSGAADGVAVVDVSAPTLPITHVTG